MLGTRAGGGLPFLARPVALSGRQLARHRHVIGVTGQGKSKLMASMVTQLIAQGIGCALVDPQADLALDVLDGLLTMGFFARPDAQQRVLYLDFTRSDRFLPFNILCQPRLRPTEVAQYVAEVCKRAWTHLADGAAPQFENILLSAVVVLVENGLPLTELGPVLTSKPYRERLLGRVTNPRVIDFFHGRFDHWGRDQPLMLESTLNKVYLLTFSEPLLYALGQTENALDLRQLMDDGVSLVCNLGGLSEDDQRFIGSLLCRGFEVAALSRADVPEHARRPYHLFLDEFHLFAAQNEKALDRVLSLARKYGLTLTLAHQTWSQTSERLQGALQNTTHLAFKVGPRDAVLSAPAFGAFDPYEKKHEVVDEGALDRTHPLYFGVQESYERWATALKTLPERHAYLAIDGTTTQLRTLEYRAASHSASLQALVEGYAQQLLAPRARIERELARRASPVAASLLTNRVKLPG